MPSRPPKVGSNGAGSNGTAPIAAVPIAEAPTLIHRIAAHRDRARPDAVPSGGPLSRLGPGLIAGASDDDPSGIATYSQVGAQFGLGLAWTMLYAYPLLAAIQEIAARIGRVTGRGIAANIRRHYPPWLLRAMVAMLLVANIFNLGADLGAMAEATTLLIGGPIHLYTVMFAILCVWLEVFSRYDRYVRILKWTALSLLSYVAAALAVGVPWGDVALATLVPDFVLDKERIVAIVAVLGTTITPYCFFWQSSQEAEDERTDPNAHPLLRAPGQAAAHFKRIRFDTWFGMAFAHVIGLCVIVTTAATLHAHGVRDVASAAQAAEALRPIAGPFTFFLFAAGMIGIGLLAVPVLAGSAAYAVGEAMGWRVGLGRLPKDAKAFYGTIAAATAVGMGVDFAGIEPMKALFWASVLNGIVSVPLMVMAMLLAMRPDVMGRFVLPRPLWAMGWLCTLTMALAVGAMFVLG